MSNEKFIFFFLIQSLNYLFVREGYKLEITDLAQTFRYVFF